MLMQVAWSWTDFVNVASRQGQIRAASSLAISNFYQTLFLTASMKTNQFVNFSVLVRWQIDWQLPHRIASQLPAKIAATDDC